MTTENRNADSTGAEANKPEIQNEGTPKNGDQESQMNIVEQRLAEINAGKQAAQQPEENPEVPKEEQPEIQPDLKSTQESESSESITEAFAEANKDIVDEATPTEAPATASEESTEEQASAAPQVETTEKTEATTTQPEEHHDDEEEFEDHTDYSQMSLDELRQHLTLILKSADANKRHRTIIELHKQYDAKFQAERAEALDKFKQEGGTEDDFDYHTSPEHQNMEALFTSYRDSRYKQRQNMEEQRQRNLERKRELLTQLRALVESAETKNSTDEVKKIQNEWKSLGQVPAGSAQELWDSYHALLDIFYNNRSIFFELKELDRKRNLDAKLQLIDRAEALSSEESINKALQELRHLHEEWKSIGPVPNDQRDPIWDRFIQASEKVHEKRRNYQENRREIEMANLDKKRKILERLQAFQGFNTDRINEWRDKTDEIQKLKEEWDAAGLVPKEHAEEVNKNFWGNYKAFFQHKNQFFKGLDEQKMQNLRLKTELCEEAESLKESTDWNSTKEKLIQLQKKWKTIGRVPDKHSDKIWQRFRTACNEFFDRKQTNEQQKSAEQEKLSAEKLELCERIASKLAQPTATGSLEEFEQFKQQWADMDSTTKHSSPKAEDKYIALMEKYLERVPELSLEERTDKLVKLQVDRMKHSPDAGQKLHQRENTIRREISQLQNDIQTLRTNIEFFARSKNADKLRVEYEGRIADAQKRISMLQHQLDAYRS
ncbi:hypothetical protein ABID22_003714 [Pontibacter aydingkolensis]|uniref:DUF349 domain-containing protein n=1 Tax=Pontibacter aydingkolensis TaxID=1911536 RepID=A0ABS7CYR9_9BACT|nr:DUF349 domain-containing protein [Pontibacter aydingkolensis]MBW7469011.1 DUF349 domain-containing protein [Pontibacter aydingkolensis]